MARSYTINGKSYPTQKAVLAEVDRIKRPPKRDLDGDDLAFVRDLFTLHPSRDAHLERVGGLERIFVDRDWEEYRGRGEGNWRFYIAGPHGSTPFSYRHCLRPEGQHAAQVSQALRNEVHKQVLAKKIFAADRGLPCAETGARIRPGYAKSEVHHDGDQTFASIRDAFLSQEGITIDDLKIVGDSPMTRVFEDRFQAARWKTFHAQCADLKVVTPDAHKQLHSAAATESHPEECCCGECLPFMEHALALGRPLTHGEEREILARPFDKRSVKAGGASREESFVIT